MSLDTPAVREHTASIDTDWGATTGTDDPGPEGVNVPSETVSGILGGGSGPHVVGLGEVTHGTRECFLLKSNLVRELVEHHGFRTLAMEANVAETRALDAFVRRGVGDPATALRGLHKWMWQVESVRDLLGWLRSFNRTRPADDQVRVRGLDLSHPAAAAAPLRSYLETVDPDYAEQSDALARLDTLAGETVPDDAGTREYLLGRVERAVTTVAERLDDEQARYVAATGDRWETARHLCRVVRQTCDWHRVRHEQPGPHAAGMQQRDRAMAENAAWCARQDPGTGVAVWAHNVHVERGTFDSYGPWADATGMGEFLAREFGARYTPVGFDTARGRFRAVRSGGGDTGPEQFVFDSPPDGSATAEFDRVGESPWLFDIASAATDPRLRDWVTQQQQVRCVGTVYDPDTPARHHLRTPLTSFDGLLFLDRSTPSRPVADPEG